MPKTTNNNQENKTKAEQGKNTGAGVARSTTISAKDQVQG